MIIKINDLNRVYIEALLNENSSMAVFCHGRRVNTLPATSWEEFEKNYDKTLSFGWGGLSSIWIENPDIDLTWEGLEKEKFDDYWQPCQ